MFQDDLQNNEHYNQIGSKPREKQTEGTIFHYPLIIFKKNDFTKLVLDARYLNYSNTHQSYESWTLELIKTQVARGYRRYKSSSNFLCTLAEASIHGVTITLTRVSSAEEFSLLFEFLMALNVVQTSSGNKCLSSSKIWFSRDLRQFALIKFYPRHIPKQRCYN